ncbi:MAG: hypothetical protein M1814_005550 [Vezdaea aestivalis]|nr:MAG: hypothetical protein M1814_005550 [Vezdaea aestivalis]
MSGSINIELPSRLGVLPQLPTGGRSQRYFQKATILGKRKRSEILIATDRERIDVFDVDIPRRLFSYSVPPDQVFTCAPCTYTERQTRYTYAAVTDGLKHSIIGFRDTESTLSSSLESSKSNIESFRFEVGSPSHPIRFLHIVPVQKDSNTPETTHTILAIDSSGSFTVFSASIQKVLGKSSIARVANLSDTTDYGVNHSALASDAPTLKSFKQQLQSSMNGQTSFGAPILGLVVTPQSKSRASGNSLLILLQLGLDGGPIAAKPSTYYLLSPPAPLPPAEKVKANTRIQHYLDLSSGTLLRTSPFSVEKFDIFKPSLINSAALSLNGVHTNSMQSVGQDLIMGAVGCDLTIFDLNYGSLQSFLHLHSHDLPTDARRPEKKKVSAASINIELIAAFPSRNTVVGVHGTSLLGFHISGCLKDESLKDNVTDSLPLIHCVAKGNVSREQPFSRKTLKDTDIHATGPTLLKSLRAWEAEVGRLERSGESRSLDLACEHFLASLQIYNPVDGDNEGSLHQFPNSFIDSLIRRVFQHGQESQSSGIGPNDSRIRLGDLPLSIFRWLLRFSELSVRRIEVVICGSSSSHSLGWFSRSLVDADSTMELLVEVLHSPTLLDPEDLLSAINLLVESLGFRDMSTYAFQRRELDSKPPVEEDEINLQLQQEAASRDLDLAISVLDSDIGSREQALTAALIRLSAFDSSRIVQAMHSVLSKGEIVDIVQLLRMQIRNAGWLTTYSEVFEDNLPDQDEPFEQQSILVMSKIVDCALRSVGLGISAFENTQDGMRDVMEDLVFSLKAEISAILEGVQGATYLHGIIAQLDVFRPKKRKMSIQSTTLPLSLWSESRPSFETTEVGGRIRKRPKREIAQLRHMQVPKYSIDKIKI